MSVQVCHFLDLLSFLTNLAEYLRQWVGHWIFGNTGLSPLYISYWQIKTSDGGICLLLSCSLYCPPHDLCVESGIRSSFLKQLLALDFALHLQVCYLSWVHNFDGIPQWALSNTSESSWTDLLLLCWWNFHDSHTWAGRLMHPKWHSHNGVPNCASGLVCLYLISTARDTGNNAIRWDLWAKEQPSENWDESIRFCG